MRSFFCHRDILTLWNTHRIRAQKSIDLPSGIPNHIFDFSSEYGPEKCGNNYR